MFLTLKCLLLTSASMQYHSEESVQSQGGKARAEKLSSEERKLIASQAAAVRWKIPAATHEGRLSMAGWSIPVYNLEDGRRLVAQRGFMEIVGFQGRGDTGHRIAVILDNPVLKSQSIKNLILDIKNPVRFLTSTKAIGHGYEPELITRYCRALLDARRVKALTEKQLEYAECAERFLVALADTGLAALIDEATGFQLVRDRHALNALLDKYLLREFAPWAKRFRNEYYMEIFRLNGWQWKGLQVQKPSIVGTYTNDIVYSRIEVGLLEELQKRNPWDEVKKRRKGHHHSLLTTEIGVPALTQHLHTVETLMRGFPDGAWSAFHDFLDRVLPPKTGSVQLLLDLGADLGDII